MSCKNATTVVAGESTEGILDPGTGRVHFELTRRRPDSRLADFVDNHWIVRWDLGGAESFTQEILPHPCVNIASEPGLIGVHGIPLGRSPHTIEGTGAAFGTKFLPGGFAPFVDLPIVELSDRIVPLAELFGADGVRLEAELVAVDGEEDAHFGLIEEFLVGRRPPLDERYELVRSVSREMLTVAPGTTVAKIAAGHGVSPRTLQRAFHDHVGAGPKWVLKRYRMHEAAERIASGEFDDAASLALELGYFDQAHFVRDFSEQIGCSPGTYESACAAAAGRV